MDYRFNFKENAKIISVEIKCCGQHIGEIRFKDGEEKTCPICGMRHELRMDYNHFHLTRHSQAEDLAKEKVV
jgi:hypothetical protein